MVAPGVTEFVKDSVRLRGQLAAAEHGWRRWLADDGRQELRQLLQPRGSPAAGDADRRTGGGAWRQLVTQVNQVRQRVLRLRQLCQPPLRHQDLAVIQRVADSVREQALSVSQRCVQRQRELEQQERDLAASVDSLCDRVRQWSVRPRDGQRPATAPGRSHKERPGTAPGLRPTRQRPQSASAPAQPSELAAFDAFLRENGGPTGGWDQIDHDLFLKLRTRHRGVSRQCQAISQNMSSKPLSEIVAHVQWHEQLLELSEQRRWAVREWREARRAQTAAAVTSPRTADRSAAGGGPGGPGPAARRRQRARSRPARTPRPPPAPPPPPPPPVPPVPPAMARERAARRAAASEYRQQRQQEEQRLRRRQQLQQDQDRHLRAQLAAKTLAIYRRRDAEQMERQKSARLQRSRQVAPPAAVRPRSAGVRCPARLLAETSATRRRRQAAETHPGPVSVGLAAVPRRGVPKWRAGL